MMNKMMNEIKDLWSVDKIGTFLIGVDVVLLIIVIALLIYATVVMMNGCPVCGGHEWTNGEMHRVLMGGMHKMYEQVCVNCGYIL